MYKYILWDNDGVLVDTEYWYFQANLRALGELGIDLDKPTYLAYMSDGKSCWDIARESGASLADIDLKRKERNSYYQGYIQTENIEISGVGAVLESLSTTHKMAIVTTSKGDDFDLIHRNSALVSFMDFVIVREDYEKSKPDPEPYLYGLKKFGALPSETLVVEDSRRGLRSAVSAGIDCAIVHNEFTKAHDFTGAKYFIESLSELPGLLKV